MKIMIMSREKIENFARRPFDKNTAVISITDFEWTFAELENKPEYLLQLKCDDIDGYIFRDELGRAPTEEERRLIEEKYHMLSDEQAAAVAEFYKEVCDTAQTIICQCEHGQSRSAAIAAAIAEHRNRKGIMIFSDDRYSPNKLIFRKVLKALRGDV